MVIARGALRTISLTALIKTLIKTLMTALMLPLISFEAAFMRIPKGILMSSRMKVRIRQRMKVRMRQWKIAGNAGLGSIWSMKDIKYGNR